MRFKKTIKWLITTRLLAFPRRIVVRVYAYLIEKLIFRDDPERLKVITLTEKIKNEEKLCIAFYEAHPLFMAVKNTSKINGDIAEIGVYTGGSAKIICEAKGEKTLHLFDTFEGLPDLCELDDSNQFYKGEFSNSIENVKTYLQEYSNVYFYKGLFPSTAQPIKNKKFSLVNIDVDLYASTLSCLEFFYPRMSIGGVIISHDYMTSQGVRKAVDNFFKNKPEPIIELFGSQCLIVKCVSVSP